MKLHPDDPRLTAWLLGELPPDETDAVKRAIDADPALQESLWELNGVRDLLHSALARPRLTLTPEQREDIRRAAQDGKTIAFAAKKSPWFRVSLGLAAAAAIALLGLVFLPQPDRKHHSAATEATAPKPEPTPPAAETVEPAPPPAAEPPPYPNRGAIAIADASSLALPIQTSAASLPRIRESIRTEGRLPGPGAVRLEQILNHFAPRPAGATVVARFPATEWHPDTRNTGATTHAATLATEILACPWKPSATLVLISVRGNPYRACEVSAKFHANTANVLRYRLLGVTQPGEAAPSPAPTHLPANASATLALEVDPADSANELGAIEWSINGQPAAPVPLTHNPGAEPSNDARFAALACAYAQWLTGERTGLLDAELLAALAREISADDLPEDRADFLKLVFQSLNL